MADISLLFDVAGGGELSGESGDTIQRQLESIVSKINNEPFKIKFKADEESLGDLQAAVQKITDSLGEVNLGNITIVETNQLTSGIKEVSEAAQQASQSLGVLKTPKLDSNIENITAAFKKAGIDSQETAVKIAESFRQMNVEIQNAEVKAVENSGKNPYIESVAVSGIKQLKDGTLEAVNAVVSLDEKTQEVTKTVYKMGTAVQKTMQPSGVTKRVGTNFYDEQIKAINRYAEEVASAMKTVTDLQEIDGEWVATESKYVAKANNLNELKKAYVGIGQFVENNISSSEQEAAAVDRVATAYKKAQGQIEQAISNRKVGTTGYAVKDIKDAHNSINTLISDYERLKKEYPNTSAFVKGLNGEENTRALEAIDSEITRLKNLNQTLDESDMVQADFNQSLKDAKVNFNAVKTSIIDEAAELKRYNKAEQESLRDSNALSKALITNSRMYKQATEAVQKYTAAKNGKSSNEFAALEQATKEIDLLNDRLKSGAISQKDYIKESNRLKAVVQQSTAAIKANGEAHLSLGDKIKLTAEKFSQYFTAAKVIQALWQASRQMVQISIDLDYAFAQLKIVTGATDNEMKEFSQTAIELSKNLGQSVIDVTKSIETFSRLGYNLTDASELAKYATILANTASVSTEDATAGLTSIIKGFGLDISNTEHVADVLIEVGQKYAVSAGELMEAFMRSGAALDAANTSFEKSSGLIAAANASVQDASVVGTALKTISARIRGSKSELEELGEDTSDLAQGFSKYAEELKALTGFDIMVDGSTTEFKDIYDIFSGISKTWDSLTDTSQARVAEILGGTRQLQVITSIIGNWKDAAGAYDAAMESAGVATEANSIYMETAQARINQFTATFEEFSSDMISSDIIGFIMDFSSAILGAADNIVKLSNATGTLPMVATTIATILSFKNVGRDKMFSLSIVYMPTAMNFC